MYVPILAVADRLGDPTTKRRSNIYVQEPGENDIFNKHKPVETPKEENEKRNTFINPSRHARTPLIAETRTLLDARKNCLRNIR